MPQRSVTAKQLRSECNLLEKVVLRTSLATKEEIDPWRPGKEENPDTGAQGYLRFTYRLHRLHARGEDGTAQHSDTIRSRADAAVMAALNNQPIPVYLKVSGAQIMVYPKSMHALMLVHALDIQLSWMLAMKDRLEQTATAETVELLPRTADAIGYTYWLLVWIVTHQGPDAPFAVEDDAPEIPEHIRTIDPLDVFTIVSAFQQHALRLQAVRALLDNHKVGDKNGKRPSWSMFFSSLALDLHETPTTLIKHRSLIELIASVTLSNEAKTPPEKEPVDATN